MQESVEPSGLVKGSKKDGAMAYSSSTVGAIPPNATAPAAGTMRMAKNIMTPWMKSVQQTAKKPPTKV